MAEKHSGKKSCKENYIVKKSENQYSEKNTEIVEKNLKINRD